MGKESFVDTSLVKIRGRLQSSSTEANTSNSPEETISANKHPMREVNIPTANSNAGIVIPDKEWKKALFARWDEYRAIRRDVLVRLRSRISQIPEDVRDHENAIVALKKAEKKLNSTLGELELIDDSHWNRSNFSNELGVAMKKVENARLECIMIEGGVNKVSSDTQLSSPVGIRRSEGSFIHELASISFAQAVRLGFGLFFSLMATILLGAILLALFNYLSVN
jgi:hypothetical protein